MVIDPEQQWKEEEEQQRRKEIVRIVLIALFVALVIVGIHAVFLRLQQNAAHARECQDDPRLLYAIPCADRQDCLDTCVKQQRSGTP